MKKYANLSLLLALTATFTNTQFPIKIPKVKVPKVGNSYSVPSTQAK